MAKVAIGVVEPLQRPLYSDANGHEDAEPGSLMSQNGSPTQARLMAVCSQPCVVHCDTSVCHLTWHQPSYTSAVPADAPRLSVRCFQIDWAEVSYRGNPPQQVHIGEDAWRPLPSGDVCIPEVKVGGLRPGKSYAVRIKATLDLDLVDTSAWDISIGCSPPRVFTTLPTVPSPVKPPLLVARDRKSLKVKWNMPDEPGGESMQLSFQLFMAPGPQGWTGPCNAQGFVEVYQGPDRSFKVSKLVPGARYSFWVLARNSVGYSEPGQVASYTTQATVPAQPEPPRPVSCTQSSITLQWVAPPGNGAAVSNYVLERDEGAPLAVHHAGSVSNAFSLAYAGPLQTVMIGGLRSGMHYRFRLRAENDEGASFWSECCLATPAPSAPSIPQSLTTTNISQQSATVSWTMPADDGGSQVLAHEVEIQAVSRAAAESMGSAWLRIYEGCVPACTISSLQPGCTYRVRVRCANSAGWGSWCMPSELVTAPDVPGAPGAPVIQQGGTTCLTLTWQPPRHDGGQRITTFLVDLLPPAANTYNGPVLPRSLPGRSGSSSGAAIAPGPPAVPGALLVHRGEEPVAQVSGLQPGLTYQFRVQACNSLGAGPWGDWSVLGTAPDAPSAPMPPCLAAPPTSTSLRINWQPPDCRGSAITGYVLQMCVQGQVTSSGELLKPSESSTALSALAQQQEEDAGEAEQVPVVASAPVATTPSTGGWQQAYKGSAMNHEVIQLHPCTRYLLRVAAMNPVGLGDWSPITALTTAPAPPSAPLSLSSQALGTDSVEVAWQPPATDNGAALTGYLVDMAACSSAPGSWSRSSTGKQPGTWQQVATVTAHQCAATVCELLPGRTYWFRVRATNSCGTSQACLAVPATTDPAAPGAPVRLSVSQRSSTHARVKWEDPTERNGAPVTDYSLELANVPEQGEVEASSSSSQQVEQVAQQAWKEVYTGPDTGFKVQGLQPGQRYAVRVKAMNAAGWSVPSAPEGFTTALAPPGPPEGLEACLAQASTDAAAADDGVHGVLLKWSPPCPHVSQAPVASYELQAAPQTGGKEVRKVVGKTVEFVWEDLQPGLCYAIRVRAAGMEGTGHGPWSEPVEIVMPGHTRGVTDSADSMSAASGTGEVGPQLVSALIGLKPTLEKGVGRRPTKGSRSRQGGKGQGGSALNHSVASHYSGENDDALSMSGSGLRASGSAAAAAAGGRNRVNTSKLVVAAVQKPPKQGLLKELQQLTSVQGCTKACKKAARKLQRVAWKHAWRIFALIMVCLCVWLIQWVIHSTNRGLAVGTGHHDTW